MKKKLKSLEKIKPANSGLSNFDSKKLEAALRELEANPKRKLFSNEFYKFYGFLLSGRYAEIETAISLDPSLVASIEVKALKVLLMLILEREISEQDVFPFSTLGQISKIKTAENLARTLVWLIGISYQYSLDFQKIFPKVSVHLWKFSKLVPDITWHYSLFILEMQIESEYSKVFDSITNFNSNDFDEENIFDIDEVARIVKRRELWKSFTLALYYRRTHNLDKSELQLEHYRDIFSLDALKPVQIVGFGNINFYNPKETLANWEAVLHEADIIQKDIETLAGLESQTCEYFECSDCCSNTFPTMSFTEYEYLKSWLKKNNYDLEKIYKRSEAIQKEHEHLHGTRLPIVDKSLAENLPRGAENPYAFKFACPFLEEGHCSIHFARPLICRGFGSSTDNAMSIKTCNYYQAQYRANANPENKRYVYDLRQAQMLARASDKQLTGGKELKGTIVAWFSQ